MSIYSVILDIAFLIIGVGVICSGFRNGFLRSVVSLVGTILVVAASLYLGGKLAGWPFSAFINAFSRVWRAAEFLRILAKRSDSYCHGFQ